MAQLPEKVEKNLKEAEKEIGEHNIQQIREHLLRSMALPTPITESNLKTMSVRLKTVARLIGRPLDDLKEKDLQTLNLRMREKGMVSGQDYRKVLKRFLLLKNKKKYFDLIDSMYLKAPSRNGHKLLVDADEFWSKEECNRYLEESYHHSPKQSAWAGLWLATGCRPHELLMLCKKDIECKEDGSLIVRVSPKAKTGKRSVVLQGNEGAGVWYYLQRHLKNLENNQRLFPYSYNAALKTHRYICKRVRIGKTKKTNFYIARKQRLTDFYNRYGLAKAASMSGHTPGSKSMRHYVAMSEEMLQQKELPNVESHKCPNPQCNAVNDPHYSNCQRCGAPLSQDKFNALVQKNMEGLIELVLEKHGLINSQ